MKSAKILKEKISSNQITLGVLTTFHFWPGLVEIARDAGLDYIIVDLEHYTHDTQAVESACAIGRLIDFPVLIRPAETAYPQVRLAADLGPCGFLLPQVRSVETLAQAKDALYMPPRGKRRPGGRGNNWVSDFQYETWKTQQEDHWIVLPQIESAEGVQNAEAIAADPLTTAIAVGPYDLSASLGVCWNPDDALLRSAIQTIRDAGSKAGKNMWMIGDGNKLVKEGFTFICFGDPVPMMAASMKNVAAGIRQTATPAQQNPTAEQATIKRPY